MNPVKLPDGTLFRSEAAAARHLRVNLSTLRYHLDRVSLDVLATVGVRSGPVPCEFDGVKYATQAEAAKALGISPQAVSMRLKWARKRAERMAAE